MIQQTEQSDCIPIFTEDEPTRRRGRRPFVVLATTEAVQSAALDRVAARAAGVVAGEPELADALRQAEEIFEEEVEEGQILEERPIVRAEDLPPVPPAVPPPLPVRALGEAVHAMPPVPLPPPPPPVAKRRTPPLPPQPLPAIAAPRRRHAYLAPEVVLGLLGLLLLLVPLPAWACGGPHHGAELLAEGGNGLLSPRPYSATRGVLVTRLEPQAETGEIHRPPPPPGPDPVARPPVGADPPTTYHAAAREFVGCQLVPPGSTTSRSGAAGAWLLCALVMVCLWLVPANGKGRR